jgi:hypothetical protein
MGISLLASPWLGFTSGAISLAIRSAAIAIYLNLTSIRINQNTKSKYRATTLSTFNLIKNIPYVLTAFLLGSLMDIHSPSWFALVLGMLLMVAGLGQIVVKNGSKKS